MNESTRTVLIVDDDPQILRLVEKMLRPHHVTILSAPRPTEALTICQTQPVDLLISDVVMPEMDGHKLADKVLKLHPDAKVLLISGQREQSASSKARQIRFLKKPFFPSQLVDCLHELLPEL